MESIPAFLAWPKPPASFESAKTKTVRKNRDPNDSYDSIEARPDPPPEIKTAILRGSLVEASRGRVNEPSMSIGGGH